MRVCERKRDKDRACKRGKTHRREPVLRLSSCCRYCRCVVVVGSRSLCCQSSSSGVYHAAGNSGWYYRIWHSGWHSRGKYTIRKVHCRPRLPRSDRFCETISRFRRGGGGRGGEEQEEQEEEKEEEKEEEETEE
ncbi:hypothetical protein HZH66_010860 [Vespula vulgaris]|uniref:Uncharacterized protein n=1 Tax=Vespula vulgaris TaxID=7454 RepID=A0A834JG93_VESVU|nr:hypothetical protein HZH66_010860 [Vespula vulgaris]